VNIRLTSDSEGWRNRKGWRMAHDAVPSRSVLECAQSSAAFPYLPGQPFNPKAHNRRRPRPSPASRITHHACPSPRLSENLHLSSISAFSPKNTCKSHNPNYTDNMKKELPLWLRLPGLAQ
jgi:hypothetical protein